MVVLIRVFVIPVVDEVGIVPVPDVPVLVVVIPVPVNPLLDGVMLVAVPVT